MPQKRLSADRLRNDIDHGLGGDKVDFPDPAAAPLGTDDEAAGTPPSLRQLEIAREAEIADPGRADVSQPFGEERETDHGHGADLKWYGLALAGLCLALIVLIIWLLAA